MDKIPIIAIMLNRPSLLIESNRLNVMYRTDAFLSRFKFWY